MTMTPMHILIVEDSATLRSGMNKLISEMGHTPIFAESGEAALQLIGVEQFDLVIMDVEMPGLNGFETTMLMREILGETWVPIIFTTTRDDDGSVLAGIEAGGDDYLVKPISRSVLKAKIIAMHRIAEMQRQLTRLNEQLSKLSHYDELTGLSNRRAFTHRAQQSLLEHSRHQQPSSLLMIDVDHFKQFNDYYGHPAGDRCLRIIAEQMRKTLTRSSDIIARYGGEEFIVFMPNTAIQAALAIGEKLRVAVLEAGIEHKESSVSSYVTISVGASQYDVKIHGSLERLILDADNNLYAAKHQGRNRVVAGERINESHSVVSLLGKRKTKE